MARKYPRWLVSIGLLAAFCIVTVAATMMVAYAVCGPAHHVVGVAVGNGYAEEEVLPAAINKTEMIAQAFAAIPHAAPEGNLIRNSTWKPIATCCKPEPTAMIPLSRHAAEYDPLAYHLLQAV